jgi:hypothetical protein
MSTLLGPEGTAVGRLPGREAGGWWLLLLTRAAGEVAPKGAGELRDRRLLENCTVDASIFVKHEACLWVILLFGGWPGCVTVVSAILLLS